MWQYYILILSLSKIASNRGTLNVTILHVNSYNIN
jgi:hypothetical protein